MALAIIYLIQKKKRKVALQLFSNLIFFLQGLNLFHLICVYVYALSIQLSAEKIF